jgi:small subunit ribosomal protein S5
METAGKYQKDLETKPKVGPKKNGEQPISGEIKEIPEIITLPQEKISQGIPLKDKESKEKKRFSRPQLQKSTLETKRVVKVTKGGRRFSFTALVLIKDEDKKAVAYGQAGGKEVITSLQKSYRQAQKKLITYFSTPPRTIPREVLVNYNATTIFLKPAPPGNGIKAGNILNKLFKYLEIKDVSAKIMGSRNKSNVIRAAFIALDKLTGKKYDY